MEHLASKFAYSHDGFCSICENSTKFYSESLDFRSKLRCMGCDKEFGGSAVRERALARAIDLFHPNYLTSRIHDIAPAMRGISLKLRKKCPGYIYSNYFPGEPLGETIRGIRNENIESQTFPDASFDLAISLDVMEHVNMPDLAFREVARTLSSGGMYIFSAPTYKHLTDSRRRARYMENGDVEHLELPAEYHGNPISNEGSLVTFHYGYDLVDSINRWSGMDVSCLRFCDEYLGIIGNFTEIYVCRKRA